MHKKPGLGRIFQRSRKDKRTSKVVKSPRWTVEYRVDGKPVSEPSHSTDYAVAEALLRRRLARGPMAGSTRVRCASRGCWICS